ncbi:MAG: YcfL family protein [Candidatus Didemnitutus sp.]|nr:YcfL family protein [Candidatus Didemnitutus sp.]
MKSYRSTLAGVALVAVVLLSGCATNVNTYERAESQASPNYISDKRVITDNTLAGTFRVVAINESKVSGNLLKIQATVENLKNNARHLNYKFEWVDADGMSIDSPNETWKGLALQGRESTTISTVSINPRAVDFRLKFRE